MVDVEPHTYGLIRHALLIRYVEYLVVLYGQGMSLYSIAFQLTDNIIQAEWCIVGFSLPFWYPTLGIDDISVCLSLPWYRSYLRIVPLIIVR